MGTSSGSAAAAVAAVEAAAAAGGGADRPEQTRTKRYKMSEIQQR